jgi:hypothetical protein
MHMHEYTPIKDNADLKERDLNQRKAKIQKRMKSERALERFVLNLGLDWDAFHYMLWVAFQEVGCDHEHTLCRRILELMNLEGEAIERCLSYFTLKARKTHNSKMAVDLANYLKTTGTDHRLPVPLFNHAS